MTRPSLYVNDVDLETLGFTCEEVLGLDDAPDMDLPTAAVSGLAGSLMMAARQAKVAERQITVTGNLIRTSTTALDAALTQLKGLLSGGLLELRSVRNASRVAVGYRVGIVESPYKAMYRRVATKITLRFQCPDAYLYDRSAITAGPITTTAVAVPLGTAPVKPRLLLMGAGASASVTYRDAGGVVRAVMGFTLSPSHGATDFLDIDTDNGVILNSASGTVTDGYAKWTTKSDGLIVLDPADGDPVNGISPTLETTAGTLLALYPRTYV
jgi:hypothetical protein